MTARRYSTRDISKDRVYTYKMAARIIGVTDATIRKYSKDGLRVMTDSRPYLVRGADLIGFLKKREAANRHDMSDGQCYCMRCKAPRDPDQTSIIYTPTTSLTGRLSGQCGVCGAKIGRFCRAPDTPSNGLNALIPP